MLYPLLALTLIAGRLIIEQGHTPLRRTRLEEGQLRGVEQPYAIDFGHRWLLLGHDRLPELVASGDALETVLYWRILDPQGGDYAAALALVDGSGQRWSQDGMRTPRWHRPPPPVYAWPPDGYALTAYLADLLPGTPPGDYRLLLTAFEKKDPLTPLTAHAPDGAALGPSLDLGLVQVQRPSASPDAAGVAMQTRLGTDVGPLTLLGVNLDRAEATPGDPMLVTAFWQANHKPLTPGDGAPPDLKVHLALVDEQGVEAMAWELPPVRADWPTTLWERGDVWRGQHPLRLPGSLESGNYSWQLQLYEAGMPASRFPETPIVLGPLRVNAPQRLWEAPALALELGADLGASVTLLGADLQPVSALSGALQPPARLAVTLAWQARTEMETSYRVFLHLLRPDGELLTQSDGEPVGWMRPTTGWAPGEVVLDERALDIPADAPPGPYRLVAGLYDPDTKERLALRDGSTAVLIATLTLEAP